MDDIDKISQFSFTSYIYLFFQEPFHAHEFVERLAWRTMGTKAKNNHDEFDPMMLHNAFEKMISDLKDKNIQMEKKVEKLELACKDEEKRHWQRVAELQKRNQVW